MNFIKSVAIVLGVLFSANTFARVSISNAVIEEIVMHEEGIDRDQAIVHFTASISREPSAA